MENITDFAKDACISKEEVLEYTITHIHKKCLLYPYGGILIEFYGYSLIVHISQITPCYELRIMLYSNSIMMLGHIDDEISK